MKWIKTEQQKPKPWVWVLGWWLKDECPAAVVRWDDLQLLFVCEDTTGAYHDPEYWCYLEGPEE